jgi:hypothetical protein
MNAEGLERWLDKEPARASITLARSVQTCFGCPSQWDAWTEDGAYLYLRFRWGSGTVDNEDSETIASFDTGDKWAGVIDLDEFCTRAGLRLADDHDRA